MGLGTSPGIETFNFEHQFARAHDIINDGILSFEKKVENICVVGDLFRNLNTKVDTIRQLTSDDLDPDIKAFLEEASLNSDLIEAYQWSSGGIDKCIKNIDDIAQVVEKNSERSPQKRSGTCLIPLEDKDFKVRIKEFRLAIAAVIPGLEKFKEKVDGEYERLEKGDFDLQEALDAAEEICTIEDDFLKACKAVVAALDGLMDFKKIDQMGYGDRREFIAQLKAPEGFR